MKDFLKSERVLRSKLWLGLWIFKISSLSFLDFSFSFREWECLRFYWKKKQKTKYIKSYVFNIYVFFSPQKLTRWKESLGNIHICQIVMMFILNILQFCQLYLNKA